MKADGHEVIKWTPTDIKKAFKIFEDFVFADKGYYFNKLMEYEEIDKSIELNKYKNSTPLFIRFVIFYLNI